MNLFNEAQILLEKNGYGTSLVNPKDEIFYFEDISLMGFVSIHSTIDSIIKNWENIQDNFLKTNAVNFNNATEKAWNIYSIFLTTEDLQADEFGGFAKIEENFRGTRKIVGYNIKTLKDLEQFLLPILPIQKILSLNLKDNISRLKERIDIKELLDNKNAQEITSKLLEGI